jgi:streptogramin lyase
MRQASRLCILACLGIVALVGAANPSGTTATKSYGFTTSIDPDYLTIDGSGVVWIGDSNHHDRNIYQIKPNGQLQPFPLPTNVSGGLLAAGSNGSMWMVGNFAPKADVGHGHTFGGYNPFNGNGYGGGYESRSTSAGPCQIALIGADNTVDLFPTKYDEISALAIGPDDRPWFATADGADIAEIDKDGSVRKVAYVKGAEITSLALLRSDSTMWFNDAGNDRLGRISADGSVTFFNVSTGGQPQDVTVGPDGKLWFTEPSLGKIGSMSPTGQLKEFPLPQADAWPVSLAFDAAGDIWISETQADRLVRMKPDGSTTDWALPGPDLFPGTVRVDASGHVWVAMVEDKFRDDPQVAYPPSMIVRFDGAK